MRTLHKKKKNVHHTYTSCSALYVEQRLIARPGNTYLWRWQQCCHHLWKIKRSQQSFKKPTIILDTECKNKGRWTHWFFSFLVFDTSHFCLIILKTHLLWTITKFVHPEETICAMCTHWKGEGKQKAQHGKFTFLYQQSSLSSKMFQWLYFI